MVQEMLEEKPLQAAINAEFRWYRAPSGTIEGIVLVPSYEVWRHATLVFHAPKVYSYDEGMLLVLPYVFQGSGITSIDRQVFFFPARDHDQQILQLLAKQTSLSVYGVISNPGRGRVVGTKRCPFLTNKQRCLLKRAYVPLKKAQATAPGHLLKRYQAQMAQEQRQKKQQQEEQHRWSLPAGWSETLQSSQQQAALLLSAGEHKPLLLITLPIGTRATDLDVSLPALNIFRYSSGFLAVCLHIHVRGKSGDILPIDLLVHPLLEQKLLRKLAFVEEMAVLLVEPHAQIPWNIGAKQIVHWPVDFCVRLRPLSEKSSRLYRISAPENKAGWLALLREHVCIFPPTTQFHALDQLPHRITKNLPLWKSSRAPASSRRRSVGSMHGKTPNEPMVLQETSQVKGHASFSPQATDEVSYRPLIDPRTSVEYAVAWKRENTSPFIENFLNIVREVSQCLEAQQKTLLTSS
ncbi:hypothetical protein [Ktedonobacter sp. SOSP1-52]|uniref:hypothetical protein n=1 Tax=Ktedonobacter sp. SOSP1-52 TaxID=2778366 RepID=UPI001915D8D2|nr:hypothetical protein [Ktedonobacter sp. SOSP1-52]